MTKIYAWKCIACGEVLDSKLEVLHVHTNGNNGRAYKCEKVGIVTEYLNPPYNTRFKWSPITVLKNDEVYGCQPGPFRPNFGV